MNRCFIMGKVISEPEFNFLYKSKKISISYLYIEFANKNVIKVFGYDEMADYIYSKIKKENFIYVEGEIRVNDRNMEIEVIDIRKIY